MAAMPPDTSANPAVAFLVSGYAVDADRVPRGQRGRLKAYAGSVASILRSQRTATVNFRITGHTDASGTERHNEGLGLRRALGVQQALTTLLTPELATRARFMTTSGGERSPVASNATERDRARNRRVDLSVVYQLPAPPRKPPPIRPPPFAPYVPPSRPCLEFEAMRQEFERYHLILRRRFQETSLRWDGERITLGESQPGNRVADLASEAMTEIVGDVLGKVSGGVFAEADTVIDALELAGTLHGAPRKRGLVNQPRDPASFRLHRRLVADELAARVNRRGESPASFAHTLVEKWYRYEELNDECQRSRGTIKDEKEYRAP
jgi:OmpA family